MKKSFKALFFLALSTFISEKVNAYSIDETITTISSDIASRCENREIIAILDFSSETREMESYLNSHLVSAIFENSTLKVVTRQHMDKVEQELRYQSSGLVSDSTALSIGERLGAHKIIFGELKELDNKYNLQVKMLDVETGAYSLYKIYTISRSSKTEQLLNHKAKVYKTSIGITGEINKNSIKNISPGAGLFFDYSISRNISLGIKTTISSDMLEKENSIYTVEPLGVIRFYVASPTGEPSAGLFAEIQTGAEMIFVNSELKTSFNAGGGIGFRITAGAFYFEPNIRGGYPYIMGGGIGIGLRF